MALINLYEYLLAHGMPVLDFYHYIFFGNVKETQYADIM
jgi:hypothetical protein